jgi:hypothetical protein
MLRIPHGLDNWLIDGGEVVILTHPPHFTLQKYYYYYYYYYGSYARKRPWRPIGL